MPLSTEHNQKPSEKRNDGKNMRQTMVVFGRCWNWVKSLSVCVNRDRRKDLNNEWNISNMFWVSTNFSPTNYSKNDFTERNHFKWKQWTHLTSQAQLIAFTYIWRFQLFCCWAFCYSFLCYCCCCSDDVDPIKCMPKHEEKRSFANNWCLRKEQM